MHEKTADTAVEPAEQSRAPRALLCHRTDGRFRVRVAEHRKDDAYLEAVREALSSHPSVISVETTALTASVLVLHRGETEEVLRFASTAGLFEVVPAGDRDPAIVRWLDALDRFDTDFLFPQMEDKPQRAATGLFMLAVLQVLRGSTLPSAPTLLGDAMSLLRKAREAAQRNKRGDS